MLEVIVIYFLAKKIGSICEEKGHEPGKYKIIAALLWIVGEIGGMVIGFMMLGFESGMSFVLFFTITGGILGAILSFIIANSLPDQSEDMIEVFE